MRTWMVIAPLLVACEMANDNCTKEDEPQVSANFRFRVTITDAADAPVADAPIGVDPLKLYCNSTVEENERLAGYTDSSGVWNPGVSFNVRMNDLNDQVQFTFLNPETFDTVEIVTYGYTDLQSASDILVDRQLQLAE